MRYLLDTNILMSTENYEKLFDDYEGCELLVHPLVIEELDNLKSRESRPAAAYQARRAIKALRKYADHFTFLPLENYLDEKKVDNMLIEQAEKNCAQVLTNDANVILKAEKIFDVAAEKYNQQKKTIKCGYTELSMSEVEFEKANYTVPSMPLGSYLMVTTEEKTHVLKACVDNLYCEIVPQNLGNSFMGVVSPKDKYQVAAIDSLIHDSFSVITGKAGTGKTLLSLTYALRQLVSGKRNKLVIFANPVKTKGAEQLGFYTGSRTEKLIQNSIGAILSSKLGGMEAIDELMDEGRLEILPISDIRGYEVGQDDIMYITEAQNLNVELIKLAIQRCAEGAKIILEGDPTTQVDHFSFEGEGNGLIRAIEIFEGYEGFSHVNLPNIYRSKIADRAELM